MHQTPNVVEATNKEGLFRRLEEMQSRSGLSWSSSGPGPETVL